MKIIITALLIAVSFTATAQCTPETNWVPSFSFEGTVPFGGILQAGLFSQLSPISVQAGIRVAPYKSVQYKEAMEQPRIYPRLELAYRAVGNSEFGIHPYVGLSVRPDIGAMVNLSLGTYTAFRSRIAYDGKVFAGVGMLFLIQK